VPEAADFEPYLALERVERGPTSDVYLARHAALDRLVWIKVLREHVPLSSPFAERLEREGRLLARLGHPNVLNILDSVKRPPRSWLVLEAVDGWSLEEVLASLRRTRDPATLEMRGVVSLGLQIARALAHAHEAGIVHGAIFPKHVLISKEGSCKLSGFSTAQTAERQREGSEAEAEPGAFELAYLSPEQVLGESLDERTDVFSLGVVLYELLAGRRPFEDTARGSTAQSIRHEPAEPLRRKNREVSPELERIVQRCLEKPREKRFDSAGQLARALEHLLGTQALTDLSPMLARAVGGAGLAVPSAALGPRTRADELRRVQAARGLRQSLVALVSLSALLLVGGAALHAWLESQRPEESRTVALLGAKSRAELLVVADPWAHVFVDGQHVETTPFALPLQLTPGIHHVRLEHPNAPAERRELSFTAGQRIVLEVSLDVRRPVSDAGTDRAPSPRDAGLETP
jgi:serine/threonine-protein kinase